MKKNKKVWIAVAVALAAIALCVYLLSGKKKKEEVSFETATVSVTDIHNSITATGTIEPVTSVTVGTQVSGIVSRLYVDYNSVVKRGQVIAELDKTNLVSELNTAKANLSSAQSAMNYQLANYNRYKTLHDKGLVSADEYESARLSYQQSREQVAQSRENVKRAQTNLGYATITSPIDGVVLSKSVEEGQTVAASFNTPELFVIAKDLTDMRVIANIDEADIGGVKEGQRVSFTVDAFPDDSFEGRVTQVRQQATTESNVVTYEVVISARNNDLKLKPGLTANVTIFTMEKNNVLAVPAKALRFTPNEALLSKEQKIEDCRGDHKVWTLEGNTFRAHKVETGTSNGMQTEILAGVKEGTEVLVDFKISGGDATEQASQANNPFMPRRPGNNNRNRSGSGANGSGAGSRAGGNSGSGVNGGGAGSSGSGAGGGNAAGSGGPNR
ncbi:MAG: efflux RND transporter periplasmic adaptor subunit [Prevotella sp.]|nr:efflux RND transporter periplasmic adaptor subunit [Prevotella sp.]